MAFRQQLMEKISSVWVQAEEKAPYLRLKPFEAVLIEDSAVMIARGAGSGLVGMWRSSGSQSGGSQAVCALGCARRAALWILRQRP